MKNEVAYVDLELLAYRLGLPVSFIKRMDKAGELPYLEAGGRKRYDIMKVKKVLSRAETKAEKVGGKP